MTSKKTPQRCTTYTATPHTQKSKNKCTPASNNYKNNTTTTSNKH